MSSQKKIHVQTIEEQAESLRKLSGEASRIKPRWKAVRALKKILVQQEELLGEHDDVVETLRLIATNSSFGLRKVRKSRRQRNLTEAKEFLQRAVNMQERLGAKDVVSFAYLVEQLARVELDCGDAVQACQTMERHVAMAAAATAKDSPLYVNLPHKYGHLGAFYMHAKNLDAAIAALHKALEVLAERTGRTDHDDSYYMHEWLAEVHKEKAKILSKQHEENMPKRLVREQVRRRFVQACATVTIPSPQNVDGNPSVAIRDILRRMNRIAERLLVECSPLMHSGEALLRKHFNQWKGSLLTEAGWRTSFDNDEDGTVLINLGPR